MYFNSNKEVNCYNNTKQKFGTKPTQLIINNSQHRIKQITNIPLPTWVQWTMSSIGGNGIFKIVKIYCDQVLSVWHGKRFQYVSMAIYNMYLVIQKQ